VHRPIRMTIVEPLNAARLGHPLRDCRLARPPRAPVATIVRRVAFVAIFPAIASLGQAQGSESSRDTALVRRVADLEARLRTLDSLAGKRTPGHGLASGAGSGLVLRSADGCCELRLRGYLQSDARTAVGPGSAQGPRGLLLRRVRPVWEASITKVADLRLAPDFGEGRPTIYDAWLDLHLGHTLTLRSGKFKPPVGLERLQSATDLAFLERAHPTSLVPNRDLGVQLTGAGAGVADWSIGIFNGVPDIGFGDVNPDRFADVVARVSLEPWRGRSVATGHELLVALAATSGLHRGTGAAPQLQQYKSPLQEVVFRFRADGSAAGTAIADGRQSRIAPQAYAAAGPLGLMAEWVASSQRVRRDTSVARLVQRAWALTATLVATGEHASYRGLSPRRPFDPAHGDWGAVTLAARATALAVDPGAFPRFADPATQVRRATTAGGAVNWQLARGVALMLDYTYTRFAAGAAGGNRLPEHGLATRMQHAF
jgi:phosphate-selective porin OprO and OprP